MGVTYCSGIFCAPFQEQLAIPAITEIRLRPNQDTVRTAQRPPALNSCFVSFITIFDDISMKSKLLLDII